MLLKNHNLFLNPSKGESKRIEKIDSYDGIAEDEFNKTLVEKFNEILSKKELERIIEDIRYVNLHKLKKENDYVNHHNRYITIIKEELQYVLDIYDMDNIEMRANAISRAFEVIVKFIEISDFLSSDPFKNKMKEEAQFILDNDESKNSEIKQKLFDITNTFNAKKISVHNFKVLKIVKDLITTMMISEFEKKVKKLNPFSIEFKNSSESVLAEKIFATVNKAANINKNNNTTITLKKAAKELAKEEKIKALISFLRNLKPFNLRESQKDTFTTDFNELLKFVKDKTGTIKSSNGSNDDIIESISIIVNNLIKYAEPIVNSFEFKEDLLNASQKINQKNSSRRQKIKELKESGKMNEYIDEMVKFDTRMVKIEAHVHFKKYCLYVLAKLKEAKNLIENIKSLDTTGTTKTANTTNTDETIERINCGNITILDISKNNREISKETREKAFKVACDVVGITTNILPELFREIEVINPAHILFENPNIEMILDNNGCFNTILMDHLEAQDKIKTSKQTESENTENYKIDPNLIYKTFLNEIKNKKGIKLPKNFQSVFAILINNFIEKYKSYKTPDSVSEELLEEVLKDTKEILNNGNYLFSNRYSNKLKAQEKLLILKTEEIEFKTNKMNCTNNVQEFDALDINLLKRELNDLKEKLDYKHSCKKYYNYFAQLNIALGNALKNLIHKNKQQETETIKKKIKPLHEVQVENLISGISKMLTQFQRDIRPLEYVEDDPITMFEITEKLELIKQNSDTEINNFIKEINDLKNEKHKIKKIPKLVDISDDCVKYLSRLVTSCPDMEEKLFNCNKYLNKLDFEEITNDFDSTTIPKIREDFMTQAEIQFNYQLNKSGVEYNRKVIVFYLDQALELNKIVRELV